MPKYGQYNGMNILCLLFDDVEPAVQSYCGDDFSRSINALFLEQRRLKKGARFRKGRARSLGLGRKLFESFEKTICN